MDSRRRLEQHITLLSSLMRGGLSRGVSPATADEDELQSSIHVQWQTQQKLLKRVLGEQGEPYERLIEWRERTQGFVDNYPEREGWTDREGTSWDAQEVLEAIDKLLEQIEAWEMEEEEFDDFAEDEGGW